MSASHPGGVVSIRVQAMSIPRTIEWIGELDGLVRLIDQTRLPRELIFMECRDSETVWEAIRMLRVRGAPAIGIAGAMGLVLGVRDAADGDESAFFARLLQQRDYLAGVRPTAVNLCWALDRMVARAEALRGGGTAGIAEGLLTEAKQIRDEDAASCQAIGRLGATLVPAGGTVLTHCNAGSLATAEYGTALSAMYAAYEQGKRFKVFASETRPLLQGARLTAWELSRAGIDVTVICDNMVGALMQGRKIDCVITGADRIAANGDVANKIGTYGVAVLARAHGIPFYVAAPASTFDLNCAAGCDIPIEERDADEVRSFGGVQVAPSAVRVLNPAFDVTPAELVDAIITDRGLIKPVNGAQIQQVIGAVRE